MNNMKKALGFSLYISYLFKSSYKQKLAGLFCIFELLIIQIACFTSNFLLAFELQIGIVVKIADNGDIYLKNGEKLRLLGVDLPSTSQCYGSERLKYMKDILLHKKITYSIENLDLIGKNLAYVNNGEDVSSILIRTGHAFALKSFPYKKQRIYTYIQEQAKSSNSGLWRHCEVYCSSNSCTTDTSYFSCSAFNQK